MIKDNENITVRNLTDQTVVYVIPELKIKRVFRGFESKHLPASELRQLWYIPGGSRILQNFLAVENKELADEFGVSEDSFTHEYSWTVGDVKRVLTTGSIDQLADALDFAPIGIIDTIVSQAIKLKIADMNKQKLIQRMTGHDITKMIQYAEKLNELGEDNSVSTGRNSRRTDENKKEKVGGRRVQ